MAGFLHNFQRSFTPARKTHYVVNNDPHKLEDTKKENLLVNNLLLTEVKQIKRQIVTKNKMPQEFEIIKEKMQSQEEKTIGTSATKANKITCNQLELELKSLFKENKILAQTTTKNINKLFPRYSTPISSSIKTASDRTRNPKNVQFTEKIVIREAQSEILIHLTSSLELEKKKGQELAKELDYWKKECLFLENRFNEAVVLISGLKQNYEKSESIRTEHRKIYQKMLSDISELGEN